MARHEQNEADTGTGIFREPYSRWQRPNENTNDRIRKHFSKHYDLSSLQFQVRLPLKPRRHFGCHEDVSRNPNSLPDGLLVLPPAGSRAYRTCAATTSKARIVENSFQASWGIGQVESLAATTRAGRLM